MKHPIQPLIEDNQGILRFKENKIVNYLLDHGGIDMNKLAVLQFDQNDYEQFAQLIGYSLNGFGTLSYASDEIYDAAEKSVNTQNYEIELGIMQASRDEAEAKEEKLRAALMAIFALRGEDELIAKICNEVL